MEETKRRRYIIRAVLEGEVDVQEQPQPEPSQGDIFGAFTKNYSLGKKINASSSPIPLYAVWNNSATGRAAMTAPIENNGYVVTVTDPSLYQINVYGITDPTAVPTTYASAVTGVYYQGDSAAVGWKSEDSTSAPYLMMALKRATGYFSDEELADGAAAVFTYTRG